MSGLSRLAIENLGGFSPKRNASKEAFMCREENQPFSLLTDLSTVFFSSKARLVARMRSMRVVATSDCTGAR